MAGVIGSDGVQWERCNGCIGWVRIQDLLYEQPSEKYEYGRDLCQTCVDDPDGISIRKVMNMAAADQDRAAYEDTVYPTVCGHGAKPKQTVYRFVEIGPNSSQGYSYCSEKCATEGGH